MIDISSESLIPFSADPKLIPGRPHISTLHRWRLKGIHGVKLETLKTGGRRYTSEEALQRFAAATTAQAGGEPIAMQTPKQRDTSIKDAEAELGQAGW